MQNSTTRRVLRRPAKKNTVAAAGAGLAFTLLASGGAAAHAAPADVSGAGVDVSALAQRARAVAAKNAPVSVPAQASWSAQPVTISIEVHDVRAERRQKAEEEAKQKTQREQQRAQRAASRSAARQSLQSQKDAEAPAAEAPAPVANGGSTSAAVAVAYRYLGVPYRWGGSSPSGFDCSGFTSYVYRQIGINLPHRSTAQASYGRRIPMSQAKPGDLMWRPGHVGIYIGNGKMIHAPHPGASVEVTGVHGMSAVRLG